MKIEQFEMERMQSTWENVVDMDMSESGVRPVTLRELVEMGLDLERFWTRRSATASRTAPIALRETLATHVSGRHRRPHRGHERHLGSELPAGARAAAGGRRGGLRSSQLHAALGRPAQPGGHGASVSGCGWTGTGSRTGTSSSAPSTPRTRLVYVSNPNNPTGSVLSAEAMRRIVDRCEAMGA